MRSSWKGAVLVVAGGMLLGSAACSSSRFSGKARVDDAWLARVPEQQLVGVHDARERLRRAQDQVERATVALKDSEKMSEVVRHDAEAAAARLAADRAALEAARSRGQADGIVRAQSDLQMSEASSKAARAKVDYQAAVVKERRAEKRLREREVDLAEAELTKAKFVALQQHDDVRARQLYAPDFDSAVSEAQEQVLAAERDLNTQKQQVLQAESSWQNARGAVQGLGGSGLDYPR